MTTKSNFRNENIVEHPTVSNIIINGLQKYGDVKFIVYNRLGVQVFVEEVFNNLWDGKDSEGNDLPEDYYFYVIMSGKDVLFNGYVLIKG